MRKLRPRATHMELSLESNSDSALATLESAICCLLQQMGWRTGSLSSREWDGGSPGGLHWGHLLEHCVLLEQQAVSFHRDPLTICTCMTPKKEITPPYPEDIPNILLIIWAKVAWGCRVGDGTCPLLIATRAGS